MKNRAITLAFAACLISSFAFADSPTDAPLVPNDGYASIAQQENPETQPSHKRKRSKRKDESVSSKARSENPPKDNLQKEQRNPEPTQDNMVGYN